MNKYLQIVHRGDIYKDFEPLPFQTENNNISPYLDNILGGYTGNEVTIIEVGSWKGSSAIAMAKYFINKGINPTIFCVDTFTGSVFHRKHDEFFAMLKCRNGFPTLYQQFLSNVIHSNLQDNIIPIPHVSHNAAEYIKDLGITCDIAFIDGEHNFEGCYGDLVDYWPLVKSGGIMFCDDYSGGWGVIPAVNKFVSENNLQDKSTLYHTIFKISK